MSVARAAIVAVITLGIGSSSAGKPDEQPLPAHAGVSPMQAEVAVRLEKSSAHVPEQEVRAALAGAIATWNSALPKDLRFVEQKAGGAFPAGQVVVLVKFDADPKSFGSGKSIDEIGDVRGIVDRKNNRVIVGLFLFDQPGAFSTTGAAAGRDLQLVLTHELGHVLGAEHVYGATTIPPIMAPVLDANATLLKAGKKIADVRAISHADDKHALEIAMLRRKGRDVAGTYTGTLAASRGKGSAATAVRDIAVREGDFVIKYDQGKIKIELKGSKRELPGVDLLDQPNGFTLEAPAVADGRPLGKLTIKRGNTPDELEVSAEFKLSTSYTATGTLVRKK